MQIQQTIREEFAASTPFYYFCDFSSPLKELVSNGRLAEMKRLVHLGASADKPIPDPNELSTFTASKLDWSELSKDTQADMFSFYQELIQIRTRTLVPHLPDLAAGQTQCQIMGDDALQVIWDFKDGKQWILQANLGTSPSHTTWAEGIVVHQLGHFTHDGLSPFSVRWLMKTPHI